MIPKTSLTKQSSVQPPLLTGHTNIYLEGKWEIMKTIMEIQAKLCHCVLYLPLTAMHSTPNSCFFGYKHFHYLFHYQIKARSMHPLSHQNKLSYLPPSCSPVSPHPVHKHLFEHTVQSIEELNWLKLTAWETF